MEAGVEVVAEYFKFVSDIHRVNDWPARGASNGDIPSRPAMSTAPALYGLPHRMSVILRFLTVSHRLAHSCHCFDQCLLSFCFRGILRYLWHRRIGHHLRASRFQHPEANTTEATKIVAR